MNSQKGFCCMELVNLTHRHSDTIKNPAGEENRHNHRATDQGVPGESGEGEKRGNGEQSQGCHGPLFILF